MAWARRNNTLGVMECKLWEAVEACRSALQGRRSLRSQPQGSLKHIATHTESERASARALRQKGGCEGRRKGGREWDGFGKEKEGKRVGWFSS
eukprot:368612-Rhodomonas_salina.2